jgi:hypothetical protein
MEIFAEWWRSLVEPREKFGFRVLFALADEETHEFVWAVAHDGDFDAAETAYMTSPERAAAFEGAPTRAQGHHLSRPTVIAGPWTMS